MRAVWLATVACAAVGCHVDVPTFTPECPPSDGPYGGGDGTFEAPFQLCTPEHLTAIATRPEDLGAAFLLVRDLDFGGATFPGIGSFDAPFTGYFDGGGRAIRNLTVSGMNAVGVFNAAKEARFENLHLDTVTVQGATRVGSAIGHCSRSQLRDTTVTMATVSGDASVGGLLGESLECDVIKASLTANVGGMMDAVGGVGGSVGQGAFLNVEATVEIDAPLAFSVGGVVGYDTWSPVILQNVHVVGSIVGNADVGGLVGKNGDGSQIHRSRFEGTIRGNIGVGGVAGGNYDSPFHVFSTSIVAEITGNSGVGGFSGRHYYRTQFFDSYFKGTLTGVGSSQQAFGGFFGDVAYYGWVERSYVDVTIDSRAAGAGGFMGLNQYWSSDASTYDIARSFAAANVTGASFQNKVSLWVGDNTDPNPLVGAGSYYWSGGTCMNLGGSMCSAGGQSIADRAQLQVPGSAPLAAWDFTKVWQSAPGAFPTLRLEQHAMPVPTRPCASTAIAGLRYVCDLDVNDADVNEATVALLERAHSCAWLRPAALASPLLYSAALSGLPTEAGTCTVAISVTDGAHTVPTAPMPLDVHLGVVMTPSSQSSAYHSFGATPVASSGTTVTFTLTNRESSTATIGVMGLPSGPFRFAGGSYPGTGGTCGSSLPANGTCTLAITFAPTVTGSVQRDITLQFSAARGPVSYPFTLAGFGT